MQSKFVQLIKTSMRVDKFIINQFLSSVAFAKYCCTRSSLIKILVIKLKKYWCCTFHHKFIFIEIILLKGLTQNINLHFTYLLNFVLKWNTDGKSFRFLSIHYSEDERGSDN